MTNEEYEDIKRRLERIEATQSKQMDFASTLLAVCIGALIMGFLSYFIATSYYESKLKQAKEQIGSNANDANIDGSIKKFCVTAFYKFGKKENSLTQVEITAYNESDALREAEVRFPSNTYQITGVRIGSCK